MSMNSLWATEAEVERRCKIAFDEGYERGYADAVSEVGA
jgi:hypothetical protein